MEKRVEPIRTEVYELKKGKGLRIQKIQAGSTKNEVAKINKTVK